MIPTEMQNLIENFVTDEQLSGFNQTYDSADEKASFHFRHWLKSDEELRVRVYVSTSVPAEQHNEYITAFTNFLAQFNFEVVNTFEEIEDDYAEFRDELAYETTVTNPYS